MEMINRLTADALDSAEFVKRLKAMEQEQMALVRGESYSGESRKQRRARERAEKNAAQRLAKARP